MKKWILSLLLIGMTTSSVWGMQFQSGENLFYDQAELADEDFYIAGEQVGFLGNALQDLFIAASSKATVAGTVVQDLNVAVVEGEITTKVGDDLHVIANQIYLNGKVGGSALVLASEIFAKSQSVYESDAWLIGNQVHFSGTANDRLHISAGHVIIDGTVVGDLQIEAETISIGRKARIMGRLSYAAKNEIQVEEGAYLQTRPIWKKEGDRNQADSDGLKNFFTFGKVVYRLTVYVGLLALGCIVILLLPQPMRRYAQVMRYQVWPSLGWGILTAIGIIIGLLILIITIIGIPFAIVLGVMSFAALLTTAIGMGYLIGMMIMKPVPEKIGVNLGAFVLGFTILAIIEMIPVLGDLVGFVVVLIGLGAIWLAKNFVEPKPVVKAKAVSEKEKDKPVVAKPSVAAVKAPAPIVKKKVSVKKAAWKPAVPAFKKEKGDAKPAKARKGVAAKKVSKKPVKKGVTKKAVSKKSVVKKGTTTKKKNVVKKTVT